MVYLPPKKSPERETAIIDAVSNGDFEPIRWAAVHTSIPGHTAMFLVMADALMLDVETKDAVGHDDSAKFVRVNVTAKTEQIIADLLGCSLLTAKLADVIWDQSDVRVQPCTMVQTEDDTLHMSDTSWMIEHSRRIDKKLPADLPQPQQLADYEKEAFGDNLPYMASGGLSVCVGGTGKNYVIEEELIYHPGMACNYGMPFSGATYGGNAYELRVTGNGRVVQGRGYKHNPAHTDYSQTCVLVWLFCLVDGVLWRLRDLLQNKDLAKLANQSGPMTYLRQSGVAPP